MQQMCLEIMTLTTIKPVENKESQPLKEYTDGGNRCMCLGRLLLIGELANSGELADFHGELFAVEVRQFHVEFPRRTGELVRHGSTFSLLSVGYHCVYFVGYLWHGTKTFMTPFQLFSDCAVKRHSHLVANSHPRCINTLNTQPLWKVRMCKCWWQ